MCSYHSEIDDYKPMSLILGEPLDRSIRRSSSASGLISADSSAFLSGNPGKRIISLGDDSGSFRNVVPRRLCSDSHLPAFNEDIDGTQKWERSAGDELKNEMAIHALDICSDGSNDDDDEILRHNLKFRHHTSDVVAPRIFRTRHECSESFSEFVSSKSELKGRTTSFNKSTCKPYEEERREERVRLSSICTTDSYSNPLSPATLGSSAATTPASALGSSMSTLSSSFSGFISISFDISVGSSKSNSTSAAGFSLRSPSHRRSSGSSSSSSRIRRPQSALPSGQYQYSRVPGSSRHACLRQQQQQLHRYQQQQPHAADFQQQLIDSKPTFSFQSRRRSVSSPHIVELTRPTTTITNTTTATTFTTARSNSTSRSNTEQSMPSSSLQPTADPDTNIDALMSGAVAPILPTFSTSPVTATARSYQNDTLSESTLLPGPEHNHMRSQLSLSSSLIVYGEALSTVDSCDDDFDDEIVGINASHSKSSIDLGGSRGPSCDPVPSGVYVTSLGCHHTSADASREIGPTQWSDDDGGDYGVGCGVDGRPGSTSRTTDNGFLLMEASSTLEGMCPARALPDDSSICELEGGVRRAATTTGATTTAAAVDRSSSCTPLVQQFGTISFSTPTPYY